VQIYKVIYYDEEKKGFATIESNDEFTQDNTAIHVVREKDQFFADYVYKELEVLDPRDSSLKTTDGNFFITLNFS
jgi:hypothetical protein